MSIQPILIFCVVCALMAVLLFTLTVARRKGGKTGKTMFWVSLMLCLSLVVFSSYKIWQELSAYQEGADAYDKLSQAVKLPPIQTEFDNSGHPEFGLPTVDFDVLQAESKNIVAWLYQPDTAINYPVMQTNNNDYYLNHLYNGKPSKVGALFIDFQNSSDFLDQNTVIYGHHMRDGSMFASLDKYAHQDYLEEHPSLFLITPKENYLIEIVSAFVADPKQKQNQSPWQLSFAFTDEYEEWLLVMSRRSLVKTGVDIDGKDQTVTLSTCTYDGNKRFIVIGKLTKLNL